MPTRNENPAVMDDGRPQLKQDVSPAGTRVADVDNARVNNTVLHAVAAFFATFFRRPKESRS